MPFQSLELIQDNLATVRYDLVQLDLLIRRTCGQVLSIRRYLALQNVFIMDLNGFLEMHVRQGGIYVPFAVGEYYVLSVLADGY